MDPLRALDERQYIYFKRMSPVEQQYAYMKQQSPRASKNTIQRAIDDMSPPERARLKKRSKLYVNTRLNHLKQRGNFDPVKSTCTQTCPTTANEGTQTDPDVFPPVASVLLTAMAAIGMGLLLSHKVYYR